MALRQTFDTQHEDMIHDVQPDYFGKRLATCSSDRTIKIFKILDNNNTTNKQTNNTTNNNSTPNPKTTELECTLKGHNGPVWKVSWAHPQFGSILASCSYDHKVIIWKETVIKNSQFQNQQYQQQQQQQQQKRWLKIYEFSHDSSVNSISWSPNELGLCLASCSSDCSITIITFREQDQTFYSKIIPKAHKIGCTSISWAPSTPIGALLIKNLKTINNDENNKDGDNENINNINNINNDKKEENENKENENDIQKLVKRFVTGGCDNKVKIWKYDEDEDGSSDNWVLEHTLEGHTDWIRDVVWAPNIGLPYDTIASCSNDKTVCIWTKHKNQKKWNKKNLPKFNSTVWKLSWSMSGNILSVSSADNQVTLWKEGSNGEYIKLASLSDQQE